MLDIQGVSVRFAGISAVTDVSLTYTTAGVYGVIGPNGAGKSTLLGVVSGIVPSASGDVSLMGVSLRGLAPYEVARLGVARSFQTPRLLGGETVLTNIMLGRNRLSRPTLISQILSTHAYRRVEADDRAACVTLAKDLGFSVADLEREADTLPFGLRRLVEVARALTAAAPVVLLDEPAAGLTRQERLDLAALLVRHSTANATLLVVIEHDVDFVRRLCSEIVVMDSGSIIASGTPQEVLKATSVRRAYFGDVPDA